MSEPAVDSPSGSPPEPPPPVVVRRPNAATAFASVLGLVVAAWTIAYLLRGTSWWAVLLFPLVTLAALSLAHWMSRPILVLEGETLEVRGYLEGPLWLHVVPLPMLPDRLSRRTIPCTDIEDFAWFDGTFAVMLKSGERLDIPVTLASPVMVARLVGRLKAAVTAVDSTSEGRGLPRPRVESH